MCISFIHVSKWNERNRRKKKRRRNVYLKVDTHALTKLNMIHMDGFKNRYSHDAHVRETPTFSNGSSLYFLCADDFCVHIAFRRSKNVTKAQNYEYTI